MAKGNSRANASPSKQREKLSKVQVTPNRHSKGRAATGPENKYRRPTMRELFAAPEISPPSKTKPAHVLLASVPSSDARGSALDAGTGSCDQAVHRSASDGTVQSGPFGKAARRSDPSHQKPIDLTHIDDSPPLHETRLAADRSPSPLSISPSVEADPGDNTPAHQLDPVQRSETKDASKVVATSAKPKRGDLGVTQLVGGDEPKKSSRRGRGHQQVRQVHRVFHCRHSGRQCLVADGKQKCGSCSIECTFRPSNDSFEQTTRCTTIYGTLELLQDHVEEGSKQAKRIEESMRLISQIALRFGPIKVMGTPVLPDEL